MTEPQPPGRVLWSIPAKALGPWLALSIALEDAGTVPCQESDPDAWWPDKREVDSDTALAAIAGCWRCPTREPCGAYAIAAGEREGVWGGWLPAERLSVRREAA